MSDRVATGPLLRSRDPESQKVHSIELFFDLVYIFAITQLSLRLVEHLTLRGALETGVLLLAIWQAWIYTTWISTWFDPTHWPVRTLLITIMLGSLLIAATIPVALEGRGLAFAAVYVAMSLGRTIFAIAHTGEDPRLRRNFQRVLLWSAVSGVFWLAGAALEDTTRLVMWAVAVAIEYAGPAFGFTSPRLGRSTTEDWVTISGGHFAERCQLFILIALGELILSTGRAVAVEPFTLTTTTAILAAFLGSVGLWWVYFDKSADAAGQEMEESDDPGRLGRTAYTYFHVPMVAGIILTAVGDELAIAHPTDPVHLSTVATVLGGPALFLLGHALFKLSSFDRISVSRLVAIGLLGGVALVSASLTPLLLTVAATTVVFMVAIWDHLAHGDTPEGIALATPAD